MKEVFSNAFMTTGQTNVPFVLADFGTDLLSRKHILSHEVFDLLENSLAFSCLEEQPVFSWTCERTGHMKKERIHQGMLLIRLTLTTMH